MADTRLSHSGNLAGTDDDGPIDALHEADVALSVDAGQYRDHPVVKALGAASEISDQPPAFTLAALALAGGVVAGRPAVAEGAARALAAMYVATRVKSGLKSVVVRTRPYKLLDEGDYELDVNGPDERDYNSFPSGHTADAFAAARAVGRVAPDAQAPLLGVATLIGLVQVPRAAHHLSDVLAGAALGILAEAAVNAAFDALPQRAVRQARARIGARRDGDSER